MPSIFAASNSPAWARCAPFATYITLLAIGSWVDPQSLAHQRWLYSAQVAITAALLIWYWPRFSELALVVRPIRSVLIGGVCGILVFIIWRALDQSWASIGTGRPVENARALWALRPELALVRIIGVVLVVPIMEELFWRSFIMRWSEKSAFLNVSPAEIGFRSLAISAILFGLEHQLIVAGVVAGFFYGELYRRSGNLWMVIMAHATTNLALEFF